MRTIETVVAFFSFSYMIESFQHYNHMQRNDLSGAFRQHQPPLQHFFQSKISEYRPNPTNPLYSQTKVNLIKDDRIVDKSTLKFLSAVQISLENETFLSFTLRGPKLPKKSKKKKIEAVEQEKAKLRGAIKLVTCRLLLLPKKKGKQKNVNELYVQATIKFHGATDVAKNWAVQSLTSDDNRSEVMIGLEDLISGAFIARLTESAGNVDFFDDNDNLSNQHGIQKGELITAAGTYTIKRKKNTSSFTYQFEEASDEVSPNQKDSVTKKIQPSLSHDNAKNVPLSSDAEFLQKLGVSNPDGKPRPGMSSKLRQCQRFVEIVGTLVETHISLKEVHITKDSKDDSSSSLKMVDMGCGRGYLTFSLHAFLMEKFGKSGTMIESVGIDIRPKLVREINGIAQDLGKDFQSLQFIEGAIERFLPSSTATSMNDGDEETVLEENKSSLDILIALHACDTATDDSLWFGISRNTKIIVTAPCCHKETRRQLDPFVSKMKFDHPLYDVLRHGIYRERIAESVTDSIRAILLEIAGYDVQVFEFIGGEHTSKNVMITAVKRKTLPSTPKLKKLRERLHSLASLHGVKKQKLGDWMGESMVPIDAEMEETSENNFEIPPLPTRRKTKKIS